MIRHANKLKYFIGLNNIYRGIKVDVELSFNSTHYGPAVVEADTTKNYAVALPRDLINKLKIPPAKYKMELDDGTIAEFNEERNYYTDDGKMVRVITFGPVHCTVNGRSFKTYALQKPEGEKNISIGQMALARVDLKVDKNDPTKLIPNPIHPHAPLRFIGQVDDPRYAD
jgi:hypothetical protein